MDDFDDFLNQIPSHGYTPSKPISNNPNDDLDALLGDIEQMSVPPVPSISNYPPQNYSQYSQPLNQSDASSDLDELLGQLTTPVTIPPRTTTTTTTTIMTTTTTTSLDEELDELMNLSEPDRKPPQVPPPQPAPTSPVADIDDLMNQLGTPPSQNSRTLKRQPSGVRIRSVINQQNKTQAEEPKVETPVPISNSAPAANPRPVSSKVSPSVINTSSPAPSPVNANPRPLSSKGLNNSVGRGSQAPLKSQAPTSDLDDLLNEFSASPSPNPPAVTPAPSARPLSSSRPQAPPTSDLDDLMNQLNVSAPPINSPIPSSRPVSSKQSLPTSDLDDLLNEFSASPSPNPPAVTPAPSARPLSSRPQAPPTSDLDDLMNQLNMSSGPAPSVNPVSSNRPISSRPQAPPSSDLDDLMNQLNVPSPITPSITPQASSTRPLKQSGAPLPTPRTTAAVSELDELMSQFNSPSVSSSSSSSMSSYTNPRGITTTVQQTTTTTSSSGSEDFDDLINGLSTPSFQPQTSPQFRQNESFSSPRNAPQPVRNNPAPTPSPVSSELDDILLSLESSKPFTPAPNAVPISQTRSPNYSQPGNFNSPAPFGGSPSPNVRSATPPSNSFSGGLEDLDSLVAELNNPPRGPPANQPSFNSPKGQYGAPAPQYNSPAPGRGQPAGNFGGQPAGGFGGSPAPFGGRGAPSSPAANPYPYGQQPAPGAFGRGQPPPGVQNYNSPAAPMGRGVPPVGGSPYAQGGRGAPPGGPVGRGVPPGPGGRGRGFGPDPSQLDQLLGSLGNQMNNIKDIEASKGVCHFCQKYIYAECIQAMGRTYHPDHFVCSSCQKPLGTSSFYETNGEPNCETCYQNMFCPRCAYCNQAIADRCINALNQKWHVNCFVCNSCCKPFPSGSFFERGGMPYCQPCFQGTFSSKCAGCGNMASGQLINALGSQWHPQCFCCSYCRRPFNGLPYFEKDGKPYCEQHYHTSAGSVCAGCRTAIVGRCVDALGKKWHPEHFVCSYCMNPLAGGGYTEQHGSPYCHECFANLF